MQPLTRRAFLATAGAAVAAARLVEQTPKAPARPRPSQPQLEWQRDELALFIHFGINTFTNREWGDGREDPASFAPDALEARQWGRAAKAAGARAMILTAKHHDGFCLWPTKTTKHSVASSPWRGGRGDLVREFVDACRSEDLKPGLYLSPWDRHEASYGDSPRYNDFYCDQLTELLSRYGSIHEVWFDGANGEGPNGRRQECDWTRIWALVRKLQPQAVMFSDAGPDVRWIGNERGVAAETNWSTIDPAVVPAPGASGPAVTRMLQAGDPHGTVWRPGEADVSIRPGWFHHPEEDSRVKTADDLVRLYLTSIGRNAKLLLNVPPTRAGLLHDEDVSSLTWMRAGLDATFKDNVADGRRATWRATGPTSAVAEIDFGRSVTPSLIDLREPIEYGQSIARYSIDVDGEATGSWRTVTQGTTIGCRKIDRIGPAATKRLRLVIHETLAEPRRVEIGVYE